jgi:SAM-dependent methyltransferase
MTDNLSPIDNPSAPAAPGAAWDALHAQDASWRKKLLGGISDAFVLPRYVRLFYDTFGRGAAQDYLELGAGNGENSRAILARNAGQIRRYLATEVFDAGVAWLRQQGLEACLADAEALPFDDASFTAALSFDVLHHVAHPRAMAREMLRVARGRLLLTESNGLSLPRKLLELLPARKAAGERSYSPWRYRSFFEAQPGYRITRFDLYPFLFPFKCPSWFLPALVLLNRGIEYIPYLRWQCSSVVLVVEYERVA